MNLCLCKCLHRNIVVRRGGVREPDRLSLNKYKRMPKHIYTPRTMTHQRTNSSHSNSYGIFNLYLHFISFNLFIFRLEWWRCCCWSHYTVYTSHSAQYVRFQFFILLMNFLFDESFAVNVFLFIRFSFVGESDKKHR